MKMTKRYKILQKKLAELESELQNVTNLPPSNQLLSDDIEQRVSFLKGLLTAEISSSAAKPRHLDHIQKRLNELETSFRYRRQSASSNQGGNEEEPFDFEKVSVCSCTESCLNEEFSGNLNEEEEFEDEEKMVMEGTGTKGEEEEKCNCSIELKNGGNLPRFCEGLIGGIVIGIGLTAVVIFNLDVCPSSCFQYNAFYAT